MLGKDVDDALGSNETPEAKAKAKAIYDHDMFNLYFIGMIVLLNYYLLYQATEWSKLGTTEMGLDYYPLFRVLLGLLILYLVGVDKQTSNLARMYCYSTP